LKNCHFERKCKFYQDVPFGTTVPRFGKIPIQEELDCQNENNENEQEDQDSHRKTGSFKFPKSLEIK